MSDPLKASDDAMNHAQATPEDWLGGEAFLGSHYDTIDGKRTRRVWTEGEVLAACLGALTLGAAIGLACARGSK
ncbi:hypothetical protein YTPLAS18_29760 [Nitrospira sp.]|nr:hypothetical protein YTPLAS18_29760 [Nitrospira sp.]